MSRDTNFYYSFLVLPARKRRAIVAVWDFCRAVDDAVDEVTPGADMKTRAAAQLQTWRAELDACYAVAGQTGDGPRTTQGQALRGYINEFNLPRTPFSDLIDGVAMDLEYSRYPTFDALAEYCRRVASTVGLVCVEIFGYRDPKAREYAVNLGMALQLTNIIRDVAADLERGRTYLPTEDLERFGVTEEALHRGSVTPQVRALLEFECARARDYYRRASACLPPADARSLVAAEIMGGIYFEILERIERAGYDVFRERIRVPRPYRALIALRIWATSLLPRL
jgi:phytoene synthase